MSFPLFAPRRPMEPSGPPANGEGAPSLSPARAAMPTNTRVSRVIGPGAAAHGRGREALALVLWTAAVFSLLALASFQGTPPTALGQDGLPLPSVAGEDWVGPVGESWARGIVHLFGVIGWTVPFELAALGVPPNEGHTEGGELAPPRLAGDLL